MKVLILVLAKTQEAETFRRILAAFENKGYQVHLFADHGRELVLESLPNILAMVEDYAAEPLERITVLSDCRELVFPWYRCYNSLVDDFIFFLDVHSQPGREPQDAFQQVLMRFHNIEDEYLQGKLFINFDMQNSLRAVDYLLPGNNFAYFADLENFDFGLQEKKTAVCKVYHLDGVEYSFAATATTEEKVEHITLAQHERRAIHLDEAFAGRLAQNQWFAPYCVVGILEHKGIQDSVKIEAVRYIFDQVKTMPVETKESTYAFCLRYAEREETGFPYTVLVVSQMVKLGLPNALLEKILHFLLRDEQHQDWHYPLVVSTLDYHEHCGLPQYSKIVRDRQEVIKRVVHYYRNQMVEKRTKRVVPPSATQAKRICILTSALLSALHAPTMLALEYARNIKMAIPEAVIQIMVDDTSVWSKGDKLPAYGPVSTPSTTYRSEHMAALQGAEIAFHYSDSSQERVARLQGDLDAVHAFAPDVIFAVGADFSLSREILYEDYPIVDLSIGNRPSNSKSTDVYISFHSEAAMERENERFCIQRKTYTHTAGLQFPPARKKVERTTYAIPADAFVMVTVGNRLDVDMSREYIDMVCSFIQSRRDAFWLLVGPKEIVYIKDYYPKLVGRQIIFIDFEDDLAALYEVCDVYLNPYRPGGGFSAAMAMNQGLPVLTNRDQSDVAVYVGADDAAESQLTYLEQLVRIYQEPAYRKEMGERMRKRIAEKYNFRAATEELVSFFRMASDHFCKRSRANSRPRQ